MKIGNAWNKTKESSEGVKKYYITTSFDKAFLELCPQLKGCGICLYKNTEKQTNKSPDWNISLYVPEDKEQKEEEVANDTAEQVKDMFFGEEIKESDIPF